MVYLFCVTYQIDAIKERLIPPQLTKTQTVTVYATEADLLNVALFGMRRRLLMDGLRRAIVAFKKAGVPRIYVNGSFTTDKEKPNDIDGCFSVEGVNAEDLDPRFWDFNTPEEAQEKRKAIKKEFGLVFIAEWTEGSSMKPFPEFFQTNQDGDPKGIIQINL